MPLPVGTLMPSLDDATEWLNSTCTVDSLQGRPSLVQFWAISCPACKANLPRLQRLVHDYAAEGLQLISVHRPRMESDLDVSKVQAIMDELGITGPCAIDNTHAIGDLFQTASVWPCYFLFDANGKLRSRAAGQLGLKIAENSLKRTLGVEERESVAA